MAVPYNTGTDTLGGASSAPVLGPTCTTPRLVGGGSGNETLVCQAEVRFVLVTEVSTRTWPFASSTRTAMVASNPPPDPAISSGLPTRSLARGWSRRKLSDMNGTPFPQYLKRTTVLFLAPAWH